MSQIALIKSALNTPVATLMPLVDLAETLTDLISGLYQYCGQTIQKEDLRIQVDTLITEIQENFSYYKIDEVKIALKNGVRNKYGDYFGLNPKTYGGWLKAYKMDPDRIEAKQKEEDPLLSKAVTDQEYRKQLDTSYTHWVKTGEILDYGNLLCKWLIKKKYIKWDKTHWEELVKAASASEESRLQKEKLKHKDRFDKIGVNRINELIDEIPRSVPKEAARLLVQEFFIKLKEHD